MPHECMQNCTCYVFAGRKVSKSRRWPQKQACQTHSYNVTHHYKHIQSAARPQTSQEADSGHDKSLTNPPTKYTVCYAGVYAFRREIAPNRDSSQKCKLPIQSTEHSRAHNPASRQTAYQRLQPRICTPRIRLQHRKSPTGLAPASPHPAGSAQERGPCLDRGRLVPVRIVASARC